MISATIERNAQSRCERRRHRAVGGDEGHRVRKGHPDPRTVPEPPASEHGRRLKHQLQVGLISQRFLLTQQVDTGFCIATNAIGAKRVNGWKADRGRRTADLPGVRHRRGIRCDRLPSCLASFTQREREREREREFSRSCCPPSSPPSTYGGTAITSFL
jgi:hypothetical protein